jgi:NADH-quinone oxidoreductase subunit N
MNASFADSVANGPLVVVILTALVALAAEASQKTRPAVASGISAAGLAGALALAFFNLSTEGLSFGGMIRHGGYANYFGIVFLAAALSTVLVSRDYLERMHCHRGDYYVLLLFAVAGMMLIASANDLIVIFLGIELMSLCLYVLAGFMRTKGRSIEASLKYFLLGSFATGFLLYGIALIYGATGTTSLSAIRSVFEKVAPTNLFLVGSGLLFSGFLFKVAAVPFHMWAPDVYEGAPTTVTAFMTTGAKAAAFAAFISVFLRTYNYVGTSLNQVLAFAAAGSMILGNIAAIAQSNIKRMLAYSSIAHAGYMLSGIAAGNAEGQVGVMFYLLAYALMNLGAFALVSFIENADDGRLTLDDYAGLYKRQPLAAAMMAVFMFSLSGVPPFAGFFGKYYVFLAAVKADMIWLALVGVLTSVISAYYYLRLVVIMYFREGDADLAAKPSAAAMATVIVSAALVIVLGIYPSLVVQVLQRFV